MLKVKKSSQQRRSFKKCVVKNITKIHKKRPALKSLFRQNAGTEHLQAAVSTCQDLLTIIFNAYLCEVLDMLYKLEDVHK